MQLKYNIGWIGLFSVTLIIDIVLMIMFKTHFFDQKYGDKTLDFLVKEWSTNATEHITIRRGLSYASCQGESFRLLGDFAGINDTCETSYLEYDETKGCKKDDPTGTNHRVNNETLYKIGEGVMCIRKSTFNYHYLAERRLNKSCSDGICGPIDPKYGK